ncbi:hypothetical protein [Magnetospirillum sp. UT-4]|uniref:hypothetical protein n=1 Tax=Magnetospirillum sp. UT-4 TaxID=2681467 RepID=UPI001382490E|nr:hypothetical protein [Magnetospirillum sp. UT-4]CAA7625458.1 conserved hypothetical protein [Magnetospirillum sp. UT-4]
MDKDETARALSGIRTGFEGLKQALRDGRMNSAAARLFGAAAAWGEDLKDIYRAEGKAELAARDPLTRFFVTRLRGMPEPADILGAPPEAVFLMAFTAFPYLDALVDELSLGEHLGFDEDGAWVMKRLVAEMDEGGMLKAAADDKGGWRFDLMPVYAAKAAALEQFVAEEFHGDFDAFLWRYVADHDLAFDLDQAWRPIARAA